LVSLFTFLHLSVAENVTCKIDDVTHGAHFLVTVSRLLPSDVTDKNFHRKENIERKRGKNELVAAASDSKID